jgi:hypothetical protein
VDRFVVDSWSAGNGIDSAFIERQLEYVKVKTYDIKYPELKARSLIPVSHETPAGAETVKYNTYDMFGVAKIVLSYATDFPRADVRVSESRQEIKSIGDSYGFNVQEIRSSKMAGLPLEQRKANSARRAMEQKLDSIASIGDTVNSLNGLLTLPNAQTGSIPNGASGHPDWARKTGLEMLADLNLNAAAIVTSTFDIEHPTTILLPINQMAIASVTPVNTGIPATVLEHFLKANEWVKEVISWYRLSGAGSMGTDRMVVYARDPDHLWLEIPQEFEQFPAQQKGMEFEVPCHMRTGGVICPYPLSVLYADGL